jgi:hypothetical protein
MLRWPMAPQRGRRLVYARIRSRSEEDFWAYKDFHSEIGGNVFRHLALLLQVRGTPGTIESEEMKQMGRITVG